MKKVEKAECGEDMTAREIMEAMMAQGRKDGMIRPSVKKRIQERAPAKPNAFSDGSLRNTQGHFWQLGGAGVWHPVRELEDLASV